MIELDAEDHLTGQHGESGEAPVWPPPDAKFFQRSPASKRGKKKRSKQISQRMEIDLLSDSGEESDRQPRGPPAEAARGSAGELGGGVDGHGPAVGDDEVLDITSMDPREGASGRKRRRDQQGELDVTDLSDSSHGGGTAESQP